MSRNILQETAPPIGEKIQVEVTKLTLTCSMQGGKHNKAVMKVSCRAMHVKSAEAQITLRHAEGASQNQLQIEIVSKSGA